MLHKKEISLSLKLILTGLVLYMFVELILSGIGLPCLIRKTFNLYCPGCGTSRFIMAVLEGEYFLAFLYNPLLILFIPSFITFIFMKKGKARRNLVKIMIIIILGYFVLRNLPALSSSILIPPA